MTLEIIPILEMDSLVAHYAQRSGGCSRSPFQSLNLGFSTLDNSDSVQENRRRFTAELGISLEDLFVAGQNHGNEVLQVTLEHRGRGAKAPAALPPADGLLLKQDGVFAMSLSADCPLVVLADESSRIASVAHCGWRGTANAMLKSAFDSMIEHGARLSKLRAAISPAICGRCYPVGPEVHSLLAELPGYSKLPHGGVDLRDILFEQLVSFGIEARHIQRNLSCTSCDSGAFFSYRRDQGRTGRNGLIVGWKA